MIEVKVSDIVNSINVMQKLATTEFSGKTAFQIGRLLRQIQDEANTFTETRVQLVYKYGEKDENGELIADEQGNCNIQKDKIQTFNNELKELLDTKVTLNANPLKLDDLNGGNFTPQEIMVIEAFIEE